MPGFRSRPADRANVGYSEISLFHSHISLYQWPHNVSAARRCNPSSGVISVGDLQVVPFCSANSQLTPIFANASLMLTPSFAFYSFTSPLSSYKAHTCLLSNRNLDATGINRAVCTIPSAPNFDIHSCQPGSFLPGHANTAGSARQDRSWYVSNA